MVITLCGSTKFKDEFIEAQKQLTLLGHIVISVGLFGHSGDQEVWSNATKDMLDTVHKQKIDMSDAIYVVHPEYIGQSTASEIEYALLNGKRVYNLNDYPVPGLGVAYDCPDFSIDATCDTPYFCLEHTNLLFTQHEIKVLQNIIDKVYALAVRNDKYKDNPSVSPLWMHVISEITEANVAALTGQLTDPEMLIRLIDKFDFEAFKANIKDSFEDEMSDLLLLICSISGYYKIKLAKHAALKHQFNIERKQHSVANNYSDSI
jgi:hypothetical protein